MYTTLINQIARLIEARLSCIARDNQEWLTRHTATLENLQESFPSGAGIDNGISLNLEESTKDCVVFNTAFHHMINGMYVEWVDYKLVVMPSLANGIDIHIVNGPYEEIEEWDVEQMKEHLCNVLQDALMVSDDFITITVLGGLVESVEGLPEGVTYQLNDLDNHEEI